MEVQESCYLIFLIGKVIEKFWSKSDEFWIVGDGDYYVLDVGDLEIEKFFVKEGVILCGLRVIVFEIFVRYVGKKVEVKGEYVDSKLY